MSTKKTLRSQRLIWIDLEMTGLDPNQERIIEIATLVTDAQLNVIAEGPDIVISQPESLLNSMDDWNKEHHGASGLIDQIRASQISTAEAEAETLAFLQKHCKLRANPLAGNSIHQDRRFLERYMPTLHGFFHYRNVDVSSIKELASRWYPQAINKAPKKIGSHRAMADIHDSIAELKYYRSAIFKVGGVTLGEVDRGLC